MDFVNQHRLREQYKAEADDILFYGLQFDDRLKSVVLEKVHSTNDQLSDTIIERPRNRYRRWMYATVASAAAVIILFSLPTLISNDDKNPATAIDPPISILGATENPNVNHPSTTPTVDDIFITMVGRDPISVEEALSQFGSGLALPAHIAENFVLQEKTEVTHAEDGFIIRAEFHYLSGEHSYVFIADKETAIESYMQLEETEINGAAAYIDTQNESYTALHWQAQDIVYSIVGDISRDEAERIASSFPNF